jgi:hypothetical protein
MALQEEVESSCDTKPTEDDEESQMHGFS